MAENDHLRKYVHELAVLIANLDKHFMAPTTEMKLRRL